MSDSGGRGAGGVSQVAVSGHGRESGHAGQACGAQEDQDVDIHPAPTSPAHLPEQRADEKDTAVPRLPRVYVPRVRLWSRLEDATSSGVTLVVAPVGAGKTLGVAGWLRATGPSSPHHVDPRRRDLVARPDGGAPPGP